MSIQFMSERLKQLHCRVVELLGWSEQAGIKQALGYSLAYLEGRDPFQARAPDTYLSPLLAFLTDHLDEEARLLEVGAGTGRFTIPLAKAGFHVDAVEPAATGLETIAEKARQLGLEDRIQCLCGSYDCLGDLDSGAYDGCLALQSIMYCDDLDTVRTRVAELSRLARSVIAFDLVSKYGYIFAGVPDVPATMETIRTIYEQGTMPGKDTHRKERLCFATYDQVAELVAQSPLSSPRMLPVGYDMVMGCRLPAAEATIVDEFFRTDPNMRDLSMFFLVLANSQSHPEGGTKRSGQVPQNS